MIKFDVCVYIHVIFKVLQLQTYTVEELRWLRWFECHYITGWGNTLVKLYCVDNEHLMPHDLRRDPAHPRHLHHGKSILLQQVFQRKVNVYLSRSKLPSR